MKTITELLETVKPTKPIDQKFIELYRDELFQVMESVVQRQKGKAEMIILTEEECFVIAVLAGCQLVSHYGINSCKENCAKSSKTICHFETYYPCAIVWNGEKFLVGERKNGAGGQNYRMTKKRTGEDITESQGWQ